MEVVVYRKGEPHTVLLDQEDWERLRHHRWYIAKRGYAVLFVGGVGRQGRGVKGAGHYELLHRAVMGLSTGDGLGVDHISGSLLDNRRANLRLTTQAENLQNKRSYGNTSQYRGVSWDKSRGKWIASTKTPDGRHLSRRLADELEAAELAASWRRQHMPFAVDR